MFAAVSPIAAKPRHGEWPASAALCSQAGVLSLVISIEPSHIAAYRYTWPRHPSTPHTRTQIAHCPAVHQPLTPLVFNPSPRTCQLPTSPLFKSAVAWLHFDPLGARTPR